jgi:hypothetical protein
MRNFTRSTDGAVTQGRKLLGSGGQGEVWQATLDGKDVAVKVYHRHTATSAAGRHRAAGEGRAPAPYFLWPLAMRRGPKHGQLWLRHGAA